jgi:threonine aldolase
VLAAAGLVALDRVDRLSEDHERAKRLASGLRERGWLVGVPQTNIVLVAVADLNGTIRRFEDAGVRASTMAGQVRLMTHADLTDADITAALERIGPVEPSRPPGITAGPGRGTTARAGRATAHPAGK